MATSYISNEDLTQSQKQNIMTNRLTNAPLNVHSRWNLMRTSANSSGISAAESSPYIVSDSKALLFQELSETRFVGEPFSRVSIWTTGSRVSIIFGSPCARISRTRTPTPRTLGAGTSWSCDPSIRRHVALSTSHFLEGMDGSNTRDEFDWVELYRSHSYS